MAGKCGTKDRQVLISALYNEMVLLEECPQETGEILRKVKLILHQLEKLEHQSKDDEDQQSEVVNMMSPSIWFSDSEQPRSPGSVWSYIEGAEYSEAEYREGDEADGEESEVELLNSDLKERFRRGSGKRSERKWTGGK